MTQNNNPANPSPDESTAANQPKETPPQKPKSRRALKISLFAAAALILVLLFLTLLAPSIASTGFVRQMVLDHINGSVINGKAEIADWSIGWTTGIHASGITIKDANDQTVAQVKEFSCPISLIKAASGNINLGDTQANGVDINDTIHKDGSSSLASLIKSGPPSQQPNKLPNISGTIHITDLTGSIVDEQANQTIQLDSSSATVDIKDINQPITDSIDIHTRLLNNQSFGEVKVDGIITAVQNNLVDTDHLTGSQTIQVIGLNSAAVSTFLNSIQPGLTMTGLIGGKIKIDLNTLNNLAADGDFSVDDFSAGGAPLHGDTLKFHHVDVPLKASYIGSANGAAIKLDLPLVADQDRVTVHVDVPQDAILQTKDIVQAILARLLNGSNGSTTIAAGSGKGSIDLLVDIDLANLLQQLPNTAHLEKGTTVTTGQLSHRTTITIGNGAAIIATETHITSVAGTNNGKPVNLADTNATFGVSAVGGANPDLENLNLNVTSAFLNIKGTGQTLASTAVDGTLNLADLQKQLSQLIDLTAVELAGTGAFHLHATGDPTAPSAATTIDGTAEFDNLTLSNGDHRFSAGKILASGKGHYSAGSVGFDTPLTMNISSPDFQQKDEMGIAQDTPEPPITLALSGQGAMKDGTTHVQGFTLALTIGSPDARLINLLLSADLDITQQPAPDGKGSTLLIKSPKFQLQNADADLAGLQAAWAPLLAMLFPPTGASLTPIQELAQNILIINSGKISATATGSYDGATLKLDQPLSATANDLIIQQRGGANGGVIFRQPKITASLAGTFNPASISITALSADLGVATVGLTNKQPILITNPADPKNMAVQLAVDIDGDIAQISRLLETFTGSPLNSYPYQGHLHYSPTIQKDGSSPQLLVGGGGAVTQFKVLGSDNQTPAFSEDEIDIANPMTVDIGAQSLVIAGDKPLSINMKSSGALALSITGSLQDWQSKRSLNGIKIVTAYDLQALWKIVYPMFPPAQQAKFKDAVVTGKFQKEFDVQGSYPAGEPFNQAIVNVNATGDLSFATLSTNGLNITTLDVPFTLAQGHLRTVMNGKPADPAACNSGKLDLGIINIDLTGPVMLLSMEDATPDKPHMILNGIQLNSTFTNTFLADVINNPAFEGTTQSQGTMWANIYSCTAVPLSNLALQNVPENKGRVDLAYTIQGLDIGSAMIGQILSITGGRGNSFANCEIDNAVAHFVNASVTSDSTLLIAKTNRVRFNGTVSLATQEFEPMTVTLPTSLLGNLVSDNIKQYLPDSIDLPMKGSMAHPQLQGNQVIGKLIRDASQKALLNGLLGGNKNNAAPGNTPGNPPATQPAGSDPLQQLLQGLGKPKNNQDPGQ